MSSEAVTITMVEGQPQDVEGNVGSFNPEHWFSSDTFHLEHADQRGHAVA
jgi:hypothetical protein